MYRVYIEDFNPPIWAIDEGPGTEQKRFEQIVFEAIGFTHYDLSADNKENPKCWIEFPEAKLKIIGGTALLR